MIKLKQSMLRFALLIALACTMSACTTAHQAVFVDLETIDFKTGETTLSSIPYCCTSKTRKLACHGYNCGDSTKGCTKWCANN